jgi:spermidine synthase
MLYFILFLSGAVLMSLEMVGSRLLAPTFGSSIYVWGALIVVVMAALTLGYYYGGRLADRYPNYAVMGMILTIAGLAIGFLPFWASRVYHFCGGLEPRTGSLLAAMSFFFLPGVLLAAISPYGIKLAGRNLTSIGNTAGRLSAVSSAGSIFGTLLTSFYLIPLIGVHNIIHTLGLVLFLLSGFILGYAKSKSGIQNSSNSIPAPVINIAFFITVFSLLLLGLLWTVSLIPRSQSSGILYDRDSLYHHILVNQYDQQRFLHFDNSIQSGINLDNPLKMMYDYTSYLHLGVVPHPQPTRALFIGLGGGSTPVKFLHDYPSLTAIDVVEIDPEVVEVARRFFQVPSDPKLRIITQDGRLFVETVAAAIKKKRAVPYDLVVIDAYTSTSIPFHLTTLEFLKSVRDVLTPDGVVVSNIIGTYTGPGSLLLRSMTRTFYTVFPQLYLFPVGGWSGPGDNYKKNVILIATVNSGRWEPAHWQRQAALLTQNGVITEDVAGYSKMLADYRLVRPEVWLKDVPLLTDDYAPVDTLKNPL